MWVASASSIVISTPANFARDVASVVVFVVTWLAAVGHCVHEPEHTVPVVPTPTQDDVFSSAAHIHRTFLLERQVAGFLMQYAASIEKKLEDVRRYLTEYNQLAAEGIQTEDQFVEKIVGNPIHAFHLVKRFAIDLEKIWNSQLSLDSRYLESEIHRMRSVNIPREADLAGAALSLVRVQHTYNLNLSDFTHGNVWGYNSKAGLTSQDCLYVGKLSYNHGMYARAVEWFEESYRLAFLERNATVTQDVALHFLNMAVEAHDESLEKARNQSEDTKAPELLLPPSEGGSLFPVPLRVKPPSMQQLEAVSAPRKFCLGLNCKHYHETMNFNALCRGEKLLSDAVLSKLSCYLETKSHPFFILKPAKVEMLHLNPDIFLFHDLISDNVIRRVKELAEPSLARSAVTNEYDIQKSQISDVRTSKNVWLDDANDPVVAKMTQQVGRLTGLSMELVEKFQIANYGIGGHFQSHYDTLYTSKDPATLKAIPEKQLKDGDRIATLMYYLTDVARGGATVFPKLGIGLWPVKGAAVFWYNMKRNGQSDPLTLHGACPVVHGSKWVANKWIRIGDQMATRPCSLDPEE